MPGYRYAIAGVSEDLRPEDAVFSEPLPGSRHPGSDEGDGFPCGLFLQGVAAFLDENLDALHAFCGESPEEILISLEKHGALYHPCRILVNGKTTRPLVVNTAIRKEASRILRKEVRALRTLSARKIPQLPEVFASGEMSVQGRALSFFLAPWFQNFHEFHWSLGSGSPGIHVWEDGGRETVLSPENAGILLEKASAILAGAYDVQSFAQIFPWHHAAGDFVVKLAGDAVSEVRLISARQYESMVDPGTIAVSIEDMLDGLLYFFLNTMLRMRVDRLDGIGDLFFAPEFVLPFIVRGFFKGLGENPMVPEELSFILEIFPEILRRMEEETLLAMHEEILGSYHPEAPEPALLKREIKVHNQCLHAIFLKDFSFF